MLALSVTLARIETRIAGTGLDRAELLDVRDLSRRTAPRGSEVGALPSGGGEDEAVKAR
ncbi:hypothetical protein [Streptomyces acidicola]|uniref:hypothetical protein n=1 Tax=Streptomyces acidicola TaxID=2596892 RepID=UPI001883C33B|nr:hypothetical protein [Streptomyces acidicola]